MEKVPNPTGSHFELTKRILDLIVGGIEFRNDTDFFQLSLFIQ
jgi:hypothetical protein